MAPRLRVSPSEFLEIVKTERPLVIIGPREFGRGHIYVLRSGDYYYFTYSKALLAIPEGVKVRHADEVTW